MWQGGLPSLQHTCYPTSAANKPAPACSSKPPKLLTCLARHYVAAAEDSSGLTLILPWAANVNGSRLATVLQGVADGDLSAVGQHLVLNQLFEEVKLGLFSAPHLISPARAQGAGLGNRVVCFE